VHRDDELRAVGGYHRYPLARPDALASKVSGESIACAVQLAERHAPVVEQQRRALTEPFGCGAQAT
jgi:hypothetical protein